MQLISAISLCHLCRWTVPINWTHAMQHFISLVDWILRRRQQRRAQQMPSPCPPRTATCWWSVAELVDGVQDPLSLKSFFHGACKTYLYFSMSQSCLDCMKWILGIFQHSLPGRSDLCCQQVQRYPEVRNFSASRDCPQLRTKGRQSKSRKSEESVSRSILEVSKYWTREGGNSVSWHIKRSSSVHPDEGI